MTRQPNQLGESLAVSISIKNGTAQATVARGGAGGSPANYIKLAYAILENAVQEYRTLRRKGLILKDNTIIQEWPRRWDRKKKRHVLKEISEMSQDDATSTVHFLFSNCLDRFLKCIGAENLSGEILSKRIKEKVDRETRKEENEQRN